MEVAVMDDKGNVLAERRIGEIIIRSHSLFSGYHGSRDVTGQVMVNGWYRTGDLGYMAEGELYVCGRKRDLIIVGGSNLHPEDLEAAAGSVPGIRPDRIAVFGIMDEDLGTEKPIMICEVESSVTDAEKINIERKLRREVFNQLEVTLGEVHLVKKGWVVRSQAGKIARGLNREKYTKDLIKK
jgi:acyl-CoA synthetase (AMP-forming)/AMP-acid ligase II